MINRITVLLISTLLLATACRKDSFITSADAVLELSEDSLHFDTVFTSVGSITQYVKIHNANDQKLKISSVELAGGSNSPFMINVDGVPGPVISNLELEANDSTYIYVTVRIDPRNDDLPFVVNDSVRINFNGNTKWLKLSAWGQDAHFMNAVTLTGNQVWTNEKPYVIRGEFHIQENSSLTIEAGTKVYLHADAAVIVDGSLKVLGEKYDSTRVLFTTDRLDEPYKEFPGAWPGIFFSKKSHDNRLQFAIIRNAYQAIAAEKPENPSSVVRLEECIIENAYDAGIIAVSANLYVRNCEIKNCGKGFIAAGGNYEFIHSTIAAYSTNYMVHKDPAVLLTNYLKDGNTIIPADLDAKFENSIFWGANGSVENEVQVLREGTGKFEVNFINSLWKLATPPADVAVLDMILNEDPVFDSIDVQKNIFNFRLKPESPAINKGKASGILIDLDGNNRNVGVPDLGSYERQ